MLSYVLWVYCFCYFCFAGLGLGLLGAQQRVKVNDS